MLIINEKYLKLNDIFLYIFSKIICVYLGFYKNNENKNFKNTLFEIIRNNKLENLYVKYMKELLINENFEKNNIEKKELYTISNITSKFVINELFTFIPNKLKFQIVKDNYFLSKRLVLYIFENIKQEIGIDELFTFIPNELLIQIIKGNSFLNLRFLYSKNKKMTKKKIKYYEFDYVSEYLNKFNNDFKRIIKSEEIEDLLLYGLSKKDNFYLKISDKFFIKLINNPYFRENLNIEIEDIPRILLISNNELNGKALKIFKEIFELFSTNNKMSKEQILEFMNKSFGLDINEYKKLSKLFSFYISKDEFLELDKFYKFYYDILIEDKSKLKELKYILYNNLNVEIKGIDIIWNNLYNLGYNNILEKKNEFNLNNILVDSNQFEDNEYFKNLLQLSNIKIYKLSLLGLFMDKILIQYLYEKYFFENIKVIKISIPHFHEFIKLKIKFPNLEELKIQ